MKLAHVSKVLGLFLLAAAASQFATAKDSGWYIGGNVGQSYAEIDEDRITSSLLDSGFTTTAFDDDEEDTGYKLFGGYQFNRNFAIEGGYFDLGEFGFTATTLPAGTLDGRIEVAGWNLDLVGVIPLTERFSAFGRLGVQYADAEDQFGGTGSVNVSNPNPEESDTNYKAGLGLQYALSRSVGVRLEVERYRINDAVGNDGDIDLLSLGLVYRFGQSEPAKTTSAPPRPAPAPTPEPILVVVPATEQYCTILDIQFEINRDDIQLEDEEKLSVVGTFMNKYPDTTGLIEGHTDTVGSAARNMELSRQRADQVVDYMVQTHEINRSRLKAVGYGETRPLADNSTDAGKRLNRRINAVIACAQDIEGLMPVGARITMALQMEFETNRANVRPQYHDELEKVARFMRQNPGVTATVEGHTSNRLGTTVEQSVLSRQRADSVVNYLASELGIARSRLSSEGFGDTRRVAYNTTAEGQRENQRVNIIFTYR